MDAYVVTSHFWQWVDHWQTLIAGLFAVVAGVIAVGGSIWAAILQIGAMRESTTQEIDAMREATRLQNETTTAAARLQVEAALAQTGEARKRLEDQKKVAARMLAGALQALIERLTSDLQSYRRFPSTARASGSVLSLRETGLQDIKQNLGLLDAEIGIGLINVETQITKLNKPSEAVVTVGRAGDMIEALIRQITDLKTLTEKSAG